MAQQSIKHAVRMFCAQALLGLQSQVFSGPITVELVTGSIPEIGDSPVFFVFPFTENKSPEKAIEGRGPVDVEGKGITEVRAQAGIEGWVTLEDYRELTDVGGGNTVANLITTKAEQLDTLMLEVEKALTQSPTMGGLVRYCNVSATAEIMAATQKTLTGFTMVVEVMWRHAQGDPSELRW